VEGKEWEGEKKFKKERKRQNLLVVGWWIAKVFSKEKSLGSTIFK